MTRIIYKRINERGTFAKFDPESNAIIIDRHKHKNNPHEYRTSLIHEFKHAEQYSRIKHLPYRQQLKLWNSPRIKNRFEMEAEIAVWEAEKGRKLHPRAKYLLLKGKRFY